MATTQRVLLHVGTPKTGTSFVQDILFQNREALSGQGICYPGERFDAHFLAALDLMRLPWGGLEKQAVGAWDRLAEQVRAWPGTSIISHEILGTAARGQVDRALESLGDAEVHIVLTARDLVRQIPAEWQESVKHRRELRYRDYLDKLREPQRSSQIGGWFWGVQEVPEVLDRWGSSLPPERVHLITVPAPGAPRNLLWERVSGVLGVDPVEFPPASGRANQSLGVPETALLRRLNEQVNNVVPNEHYRQFVRELLVHQTLAQITGSPRLSVPPEVWTWANGLSRLWVTEIAQRGYDVVGELDDLLPGDPIPFTDPDLPDEAMVAAAGVTGLRALVEESARLRDVEVELHAVIDDLMGQLDRAYATPTYRARQRLVDLADHNPVAQKGLGAYRRLRGRSSRPE